MGKESMPGDSRYAEPLNQERNVLLNFKATPYEKEYMETIASILSKIDINGNKILKSKDLSELIRACITYTCGIYQMQVFPDSSIVTRLPDKDSVKEFIAFRKKYMNYPIQSQLEELKRMGIVKKTTAKEPKATTTA